MLGIAPARHSSPLQVLDDGAEAKRLADLKEAKRRVKALTVRVNVLTSRMDKHEAKPHT